MILRLLRRVILVIANEYATARTHGLKQEFYFGCSFRINTGSDYRQRNQRQHNN
jgi:hypothetical protein